MSLHGGALVVASTGSAAQFSTLGVANAVSGAEIASILASASIASATSAVWDGVHFTAATATLSGSTAITTAAGFNAYTIEQPTISAASALAVTIGATLTIKGMPVAGGAGPATLTTGYGFWMQGTEAAVAGTRASIANSQTFQDGGTTSTTVARCLQLSPTINYTAASKTGKVVLAYFNPTLTSQPSGTNAGISFSSAFTSSTFPAMRFHNQADEDTNFENFECGWHLVSNQFVLRNNKGGSGTLRVISLCIAGTTNSAVAVSTASTNGVLLSAHALTTAANRINVSNSSAQTATSGTHSDIIFTGGFSPTSTSTMAAYGIHLNQAINYSNGTPGAGYVQLLRIAPVNTALPSGISAGLVHASTSSGLTQAEIFYNTSDETTNYEYAAFKFSSNIFTISSVKGGSGTLRGIQLGIAGNSIGFLGHAVQALPAAYTLTATQVPSRTLNANASATAANNNAVISQMIQDLQGYGLLQ